MADQDKICTECSSCKGLVTVKQNGETRTVCRLCVDKLLSERPVDQAFARSTVRVDTLAAEGSGKSARRAFVVLAVVGLFYSL